MKKTRKKPKAVQNTSLQILEAATRLFAESGIDGVSVKEIADAASSNVSLISYYFGGKTELYRTCLERFGNSRLESADKFLKTPESAIEFRLRLGMFIDEFFECHIAQPLISKLIHREMADNFSKTADIFQATFLSHFCKLGKYFQCAQAKGFIRADIDSQQVSALFFGGIVQFVNGRDIGKKFLHLNFEDPAYRELIRESILKIYCDGIVKNK